MDTTITILKVTAKVSKTGAPYRLIDTADSRKVYCFDSQFFPLLGEGATLAVTTEKGTGGWERIVTAKAVPHMDKDALIPREVALKAATELGCARLAQGQILGYEDILDAAQQFADWLLLGNAPEPEPGPEEP